MHSNFASEFIWVLVGKVIAFLCSILLIKLLTNSMSVEVYAHLVLGLTVFNLFVQLLMGPVGQGIGRVYVDAVELKDQNCFGKEILIINKKILVIYLFIILALSFIFAINKNHEVYALAMCLIIYSYLNGLNDISSSLQNLARNRAESAIGLSLDSIIKIMFIVLLIGTIGILDPVDVIIAYLLSSMLALIYQKKVFHKLELNLRDNEECLDGKKWSSAIYKIVIPASIWGFFVWLQQASDKWMLKYFQGEESVSNYSVIYQIGYVPFILGMSIVMTFLMPMIFKGGRNSIIKWMILFVGVITGLAFIVASQFSYEILSLIVNDEYSKEAHLLPYMILAAGFYLLGDVYTAQLMKEKNVKALLKIKISTASICLITNSVGAYLHAVNGVVASMVLFGLIYFLATMYAVQSRDFNNSIKKI